MSTYRAIRIEVEGTGPNRRRERFSTTVIASNEQRARGRHRKEALFRARIWGLAKPLRIVGETVGLSVQAPAHRYIRPRHWRTSPTCSASEAMPLAPAEHVWPSAA